MHANFCIDSLSVFITIKYSSVINLVGMANKGTTNGSQFFILFMKSARLRPKSASGKSVSQVIYTLIFFDIFLSCFISLYLTMWKS